MKFDLPKVYRFHKERSVDIAVDLIRVVPDSATGTTLLENPDDAVKEVAYTVVTRGEHLGKAIRTERWRYGLWPDGEELYDLHNDIAEHYNLAGKAQHEKTLKTMRELLAQKQKEASSAR